MTLKLANGKVIKGSHTVLTVPIPVLQRDLIDFSPPLPTDKLDAINGIAMHSAAKICCRFRRSFWDDNVNFVFSSTGIWSEFWQDKRVKNNRDSKASTQRSSRGRSSSQSLPINSVVFSDQILDEETEEGSEKRRDSSEATEQPSQPCSSRDGSVIFVGADELGDCAMTQDSNNPDECVLVYGFATVENADKVAELKPKDVVKQTLQTLEDIFG